MNHPFNTLGLRVPLLALGLSLAAVSSAHADSARLLPRNMPAAYTAECAACHTGADQGNYGDDSLRFPGGLDARHRRAWSD